jgi:hypothetical protein
MWQEEYTIETKATKEKIWFLLEDVKNWNKWSVDIEYSYINGKFENGANGSYKKSNDLKPYFIFFEIRDCKLCESFMRRTKLLFCYMDIGYKLIDDNNKLKIIYSIKMSGPLTFFYRKTLGSIASKQLQFSIKKLIILAEKE